MNTTKKTCCKFHCFRCGVCSGTTSRMPNIWRRVGKVVLCSGCKFPSEQTETVAAYDARVLAEGRNVLESRRLLKNAVVREQVKALDEAHGQFVTGLVSRLMAGGKF